MGACSTEWVYLYSTALVSCCWQKWLLLKHAGIAYFDNGDMSSYNPDLSRMEQADLLPYDHKYEFPRDRLRLSGVKLGAGAFGVVYKAQALGIQPDVDETTVAVKTIKNTDKDEVCPMVVILT